MLKLMTPPFGKLAAEQGAREGNLRFVHARLITHAEEIAFYGGHEIEKVHRCSSTHSTSKECVLFDGMFEGTMT